MDDHSECSLHRLIINDDYDQFRARLNNPDERDNKGFTLLHVASQIQVYNSRFVQLLLHRGADVDCATPAGHTPLHFAVCSRNRDTVQALLEAGASVNAKDKLGRTALHFSVCKGDSCPLRPVLNIAIDLWIVKRLACHPEINLNSVEQMGDTPLMFAVKGWHLNAVWSLIKRGANPNIPNKNRRSPLHVALSARHPSNAIVSALLLNGAGIYCVDSSRQTPMDVLSRHVYDDWTLSFAEGWIWIIALRYQIRTCLELKLEKIPALSSRLIDCCKEVRVMRKLVIYENFTLHDFALGCFQTNVEDPVRVICLPVVESLLSGFFEMYFEFLLCRLTESDLRNVYEITTGSSYSLDLVPPDETNIAIYDAISRFYHENFELKTRLLRLRFISFDANYFL